MASTQIDPMLLAIYQKSEYRVCTAATNLFVMKIGDRSWALSQIYQQYGVGTACFISAYNPRSEPRSQEQNEAAQQRLIECVQGLGYSFLEGVGEDPEGDCAGEPCLLVLGITHDLALQLARQFEQNAILWMESDAIPQLVLLR